MKYKFFWKNKSPFSNWYLANFEDENGTEFNCVEQYMMYIKAKAFNDKRSMQLILNATNPKDMKKLGRGIKPFADKVWNMVKYGAVYNGCKMKFEQNPELLDALLKYKGYHFVEASPYDRIWGIGYEEKDALNNIHNWGENLLGKILTKLCEEFTE